jgi:putative SOS response-associated peptidase YedK
MCGRYDNLIPRDAYSALFRAVTIPRSNFPPRYNVAPTDQIPIVRIDPRDGERELTMARWGLIPFWMKEKPKVPHINARAETVHKLPLFQVPAHNKRAPTEADAPAGARSRVITIPPRYAVRRLGGALTGSSRGTSSARGFARP